MDLKVFIWLIKNFSNCFVVFGSLWFKWVMICVFVDDSSVFLMGMVMNDLLFRLVVIEKVGNKVILRLECMKCCKMLIEVVVNLGDRFIFLVVFVIVSNWWVL